MMKRNSVHFVIITAFSLFISYPFFLEEEKKKEKKRNGDKKNARNNVSSLFMLYLSITYFKKIEKNWLKD